ncbi:secretory lipase [Nocardia tenerifensis]|uniref:Secretory lipase n=1 Tax=Nocardia tenerifensis TaxID=228006 RepID=A0A318KJI7_9NOCA|nr:alpha/beta fold hydrolase [Nocardia tenerifensis]PXX68567.1 secretory lipase [Nocardia tenerifensis]
MRVVRMGRRAVAAAALAASAALFVNVAPVQAQPQTPPAQVRPPGTVISAVAQPDGWRGVAGGSVLDYWMRASDGTPRPASGALFVPGGTPPAGGWPVIAYDHGTSGLGAGCGGQSDPEGHPYPQIRSKEDLLIQRLLAQGFAVVAPDYLGLGRFDTGPHPYLEIASEATATIDLLRAARSIHPELSRTWAVLGASQGGQAALGTGHLQATYAPELDFRGTIAIDPESDVEKVLPLAGPIIPAVPGNDGAMSFFVSILAGLRAARPDVPVEQYLTPKGREVLDSVGALCLDGITDRVRGLGVGDLLARPLAEEPIRSALDAYLTVPTSGYDAPILLLLNITDTTVPSPLHAALAAQLAANGVDFQTVVGTGRHTQLDSSMQAAIDAFLDRVKATPPAR